jgi:hypothetical protein
VTTTKPVVHFKPPPFRDIEIGYGAIVFPVDHTNHAEGQCVSNTVYALTSRVVKVFEDGSFETMNTLYKPEKLDAIPTDPA